MSTESDDHTAVTPGDADLNSSRDMSRLIRYWYPAIIVWMYIPIVAGIPGNILVLRAYVKFPSLRNPTNLLIANQSVADLISCVSGQVFVWFNYTVWGLGFASRYKYACLLCMCCITLGLWLSIVNLLALSTERLLAIAFPYQYLRWVSDASVKRVIIVLWVVLVTIISLPIFGWNSWTVGSMCMTMNVFPYIYFVYLFLLPALLVLILMAIFNIVICGIAFIVKNKVAPMPSVGAKKEGEQATSGDSKITRMFLMVVGVFYLSWFPYTVITTMYFAPPESWKKHGIPEWTLAAHEISKGLLVLNAAANPLIYFKTNAGFRDAFRKLTGFKAKHTS